MSGLRLRRGKSHIDVAAVVVEEQNRKSHAESLQKLRQLKAAGKAWADCGRKPLREDDSRKRFLSQTGD